MAIENLQSFFYLKKALRNERVTAREFAMLTGMRLSEGTGAGRSIQAIQRWCEMNSWSWHYRTAEMLIKCLMDKGLVTKNGRNVYVNPNGVLLLNRIDRKLKATTLQPQLSY